MLRFIVVNRQLVFIDDSGDPGFKKASSSNFVMAAALFIEPKTAIYYPREYRFIANRLVGETIMNLSLLKSERISL